MGVNVRAFVRVSRVDRAGFGRVGNVCAQLGHDARIAGRHERAWHVIDDANGRRDLESVVDEIQARRTRVSGVASGIRHDAIESQRIGRERRR